MGEAGGRFSYIEDPDGTLIASASNRGHIIKIYSTDGGEVV